MSARRLDRLLRPRTVAVIGGAAAERAAAQLARLGFDGEVWPVHPRRATVAGLRAWPDVESLPGAPDAAFVGVNRERSVEIVAALARRGAGGAVCYASGYREIADDGAGAALERALVEAAGDMPVLGPNCYGYVNYLDGAALWPDQHGGRTLGADGRGVAIVAQSSNVALNLTMQRRGVPLAYLLTAGNQAQAGLSDLLEAMLDDARVSAVALHVEGIDDVARFEAAALRARRLGRPMVALVAGRSATARRATRSHTASVAGEGAGCRALLARLGIAEVARLETLLEALKLLHVHGPLPGTRIASLSCSGGEAALVADAALDAGLELPPLGDAACARLRALLGPSVAPANPLDYHTGVWGDRAAMEAAFAAVLEHDLDLGLLVLDLPRADRCDDADWTPGIDAFTAALAATEGRGALLASLADNLPEALAIDLAARGLPALGGIGDGLAAVHAAARIGRTWALPEPAPLWRADAAPRAVCVLDEHAAKRRLAAHGVPVPRGMRADSVDEALAAAQSLPGPVAVKALGIAHKTERGAVRLDLSGGADVAAAAGELLALGGGVLVETMLPRAVAELHVGVHRDPPYGLVLTIASGGVLVELVADSASLLLPATEDRIREAIASLRAGALLAGHRGGAPGDAEAAVRAVAGIAAFAGAHRDSVEELDVNPLMVGRAGEGAWAADCLLAVREEVR